MMATSFAFVFGFLAVLGVLDVAARLAAAGWNRAPQLSRAVAALQEVLRRPGAEGRDPDAAERRRVLLACAVAAFLCGAFVAGPMLGAAASCATPLVVARFLRSRRARYRRAVAAGAARIAVGIADAIAGGHSVRSAIAEAAGGIDGPPGRELRRTAHELALGAPTADALEALRRRAHSPEIDTVVAGILLQRRAGGDLARLLRESAAAFDDQMRLEGEVRAATAQARFTGGVVVALPLGGAGLAELVSPGFIAGLADGFLTAWLVGLAVAMQVVAAVAIRRLGRTRE
jgi:tight adherence protein B